MYKIKLENIKGIKTLEFTFPDKKGAYVLTGSNGSGKTSLLIALYRLGYCNAFAEYKANYKKLGNRQIDSFNDARISYIVDGDIVNYKKTNQRWVPYPRSKASILTKFPYKNTTFISTTGPRFYSQEQFGEKGIKLHEVSDEISNPMNEILSTSKYTNLKSVTVKKARGRQKQLHRNNILYVIEEPNGVLYSEQNFSLGERLLLNTLDYIHNIPPKTLLLIDEVELALHPIAQIKFFDYLQRKALEKDLVVIISTHSSSLIKHCKDRYYLQNLNGTVSVLDNCYPSYILRDMASVEECVADTILLVEDNMAYNYLFPVVNNLITEQGLYMSCKIVPIGGFKQVLDVINDCTWIKINKKYVHAFLDEDVKDTYDSLSKKKNKTKGEKAILKLFDDNKNNVHYLSITPELGVWEWISTNPLKLKDYIDGKHSIQAFDISHQIELVNKEEEPNKNYNLRDWAKRCFKNIAYKINEMNPRITEDEFCRDMIDCYVQNEILENIENKNKIKSILMPIFKMR